jgi:hypothetical protein
VNDNFGRWRSDFKTQVERCTAECAVGAPVARALRPGENDYFVLKPRHSGFYASALEGLLQSLGAKKLIITGFATDICVLFTANDAYMRGYEIIIPADCIASETASAKQTACHQMKRFLRADIRRSDNVRFDREEYLKSRAFRERQPLDDDRIDYPLRRHYLTCKSVFEQKRGTGTFSAKFCLEASRSSSSAHEVPQVFA